ncbi:MAG TPA: hypothetical protein PLJ84_04880 [Bacteroidales bacterium]|nr:hypothetical protein [Bacteroidales bacterium]HPT01912.1 hypothetical protein [Bacteroidales bacterium]
MDTALKKRLIEICRQKLTDSGINLQQAMDDLQQQSNEYGAPKDRYDPFRTQLMRRRDMLAQQLAKELQELKMLDKIDLSRSYREVGFGAIVTTNDFSYFIAVGLGKVETTDGTFYAISTGVPLYEALQGKKEGDTVNFRGKNITLKQIG